MEVAIPVSFVKLGRWVAISPSLKMDVIIILLRKKKKKKKKKKKNGGGHLLVPFRKNSKNKSGHLPISPPLKAE